ncbi:O-antigen ligase family protein [Methylobacterium oryzisoli]|uniref:O-antigen ligase family protein n=1 Tax=Methylobacterium oryzisoli TaxID=3385502 RepID=UPI0038911E7C
MRPLPAFGPASPSGVALAAPRRAPVRLLSHEAYFRLLCFALAGYALAGKGFAYVGVPPLFIGEIVLVLGVLVFLRARCWLALSGNLPAVILSMLIAWVLCRTVVFVPAYGVESLRDSVVVVYGIFALVVASLLIEKPERIGWIIAVYAPFAWIYGIVAPVILHFGTLFPGLPTWPGVGIPTIYVRLGEAAIHLTGVFVFVVLGFRRVSYVWCGFFLLSVTCIIPSRGAMLSFLVPAVLALLVSGRIRQVILPLMAGLAIFAAAYGAGIEHELEGGRVVGPQQIVRNFESLVGQSEASNLDGTKQWRLRWWDTIQNYTIRGPYFWSGKGFGVNLAMDDGVTGGQEANGPPLRSPHNVHYTILARSGVPGLVLWLAAESAWFLMLARAFLIARKRGDTRWANILLWIACYGLSIVIDATFDVAIEGPMVGIWHWCIFGLGIGAAMIYRAPPRAAPLSRDPLRDPFRLARSGAAIRPR